jgi:tetratricopeptide (TPR) repeat protein
MMPDAISHFRVFVASPGGLQDERRAFRETLEMFSEEFGRPRNVVFEPVAWEETLGGQIRPQERINEEIPTCDYFILLLWDRWGSPPGINESSRFTSGTEEEFAVARAQFNIPRESGRRLRDIVIFFKAIDARRLSDPGEQLSRVLAFRQKIETGKEFFYHTFDDIGAFQRTLRRFLGQWLLEHERSADGGLASKGTVFSGQLAPPENNSGLPIVENERILRARRLADQGNLTAAETEFARSAEAGTDPEALRSYCDFLIRLGRYSQAENELKRLQLLAKKAGEQWTAVAFAGLGRIRRRQSKYNEAEGDFRQALRIARSLNSESMIAAQLVNLGSLLSAMGSRNESAKCAEEAVEIYQRTKESAGLASAYNVLGMTYKAKNHIARSEAMLLDALRLSTASGDAEMQANVLNNLALLYRDTGRVEEAERYLLRALEIHTRLGRLEGQAIAHKNLGLTFERQGRLAEAITEYEQSFLIYGSLGIKDHQGRVASQLSRLREIHASGLAPGGYEEATAT